MRRYKIEREPIVEYASTSRADAMAFVLAVAVVLTPWLRRKRGSFAWANA